MEHNYGLNGDVIKNTPWTGDAIRVERYHKKVILENVEECRNKITVSHVRMQLMGSGWFEWEDLLANWLVEAVVEAINQDKTEADVTKLFNCELCGEDHMGKFYKSQERVIDFVMNHLFECVEENEQMMRVRIIGKAIC